MTDLDPISMLLSGQEKVSDNVSKLTTAVAKLETKVEMICTTLTDGRVMHRECRSEVERMLEEAKGEREELRRRLNDVESLHDKQWGGVSAGKLLWKITTGILGAAVALMALVVGLQCNPG